MRRVPHEVLSEPHEVVEEGVDRRREAARLSVCCRSAACSERDVVSRVSDRLLRDRWAY
jgi:hypothetical protein